MRRLLPGALVTLAADAAVTVVPSQGEKRRVHQDGMMFNAAQKERLRQKLEETMACSVSSVYLVLTASASRAMLLHPDTGQYLIVTATDVNDTSDT